MRTPRAAKNQTASKAFHIRSRRPRFLLSLHTKTTSVNEKFIYTRKSLIMEKYYLQHYCFRTMLLKNMKVKGGGNIYWNDNKPKQVVLLCAIALGVSGGRQTTIQLSKLWLHTFWWCLQKNLGLTTPSATFVNINRTRNPFWEAERKPFKTYSHQLVFNACRRH